MKYLVAHVQIASVLLVSSSYLQPYALCSATAASARADSVSGVMARACWHGRHWHCSHFNRTSSGGSGPVCCLRQSACLACRRVRGV